MTTRTRNILGISAAVIVGIVAIFVLIPPPVTYVRIVDTTETSVLEGSSAPGADINGVSIRKSDESDIHFASEVISSNLGQGTADIPNGETTVENALGNPALDGTPTFVSLGGGEMVVSVPTRVQTGDVLIVNEIGSASGARIESFDVYTSTKSNKGWELRGGGTGEVRITIE